MGTKPAFRLTPDEWRAAARACLAYRARWRLTQQRLAAALACRTQDISDIERQSRERNSRVAKVMLTIEITTPPELLIDELPAPARPSGPLQLVPIARRRPITRVAPAPLRLVPLRGVTAPPAGLQLVPLTGQQPTAAQWEEAAHRSRRYRAAHDLTQADLGRRFGVSGAAISGIERQVAHRSPRIAFALLELELPTSR